MQSHNPTPNLDEKPTADLSDDKIYERLTRHLKYHDVVCTFVSDDTNYTTHRPCPRLGTEWLRSGRSREELISFFVRTLEEDYTKTMKTRYPLESRLKKIIRPKLLRDWAKTTETSMQNFKQRLLPGEEFLVVAMTEKQHTAFHARYKAAQVVGESPWTQAEPSGSTSQPPSLAPFVHDSNQQASHHHGARSAQSSASGPLQPPSFVIHHADPLLARPEDWEEHFANHPLGPTSNESASAQALPHSPSADGTKGVPKEARFSQQLASQFNASTAGFVRSIGTRIEQESTPSPRMATNAEEVSPEFGRGVLKGMSRQESATEGDSEGDSGGKDPKGKGVVRANPSDRGGSLAPTSSPTDNQSHQTVPFSPNVQDPPASTTVVHGSHRPARDSLASRDPLVSPFSSGTPSMLFSVSEGGTWNTQSHRRSASDPSQETQQPSADRQE